MTPEPRDVALVTVGRSDWGIYRSVLRSLASEPSLRVTVLASGMHLSPRFGTTIDLVEEECAGLDVSVVRVPMRFESDKPSDVVATMGEGVASFGNAFARLRPDIILVLGDRYEMFCAVVAAVPFVVPVFHIHGGERTAGAIDDALRHAVTKLSHLHFVSTREYGRRVRQMGEDAWRVVVSGAPALDSLVDMSRVPKEQLEAIVKTSLERDFGLVVFHPTTLEPGAAEQQCETLISALATVGMPLVFLMPNADPGGLMMREKISSACRKNDGWVAVENLRFEEYVELMRRARVMVGNSSSGLIEAPSLRTAVVNVGRRQEGRMRGSNVIDVEFDRESIVDAIERALSDDWRAIALNGDNPYFAGGAAARIRAACVETPLDSTLINKGFVDGPVQYMRPVADVSVSTSATVRELMTCIDRNRCGVALVVDDGRLVAVVTDGDVRRAMLSGIGLQDPVARLGLDKRVPIRVEHPVSADEALRVMRLHRIRQLPVVDAGRVIGLLLLDDLV